MVKKSVIEIKNMLLELFTKKGITIDKIVILGSYIKGTDRPSSDIDVIIVSRDFRGKDIFEKVELTRGIHRKLVERTKEPFDLMYYSDEEWEEGCSLVIDTAKKEGEVIYG